MLCLLISCKKNEPINLPPKPVCDTTNISYKKYITKVMDENCNVCHSKFSATGGIVLDSYSTLKIVAHDGRFMGAIQYQKGYKSMPLGAPQLDSCTILKIKAWVGAGALDN